MRIAGLIRGASNGLEYTSAGRALHWPRDQRLPAGRVLIAEQSVSRERSVAESLATRDPPRGASSNDPVWSRRRARRPTTSSGARSLMANRSRPRCDRFAFGSSPELITTRGRRSIEIGSEGADMSLARSGVFQALLGAVTFLRTNGPATADWPSAGADLQNSRYRSAPDDPIRSQNGGKLKLKWTLATTAMSRPTPTCRRGTTCASRIRHSLPGRRDDRRKGLEDGRFPIIPASPAMLRAGRLPWPAICIPDPRRA